MSDNPQYDDAIKAAAAKAAQQYMASEGNPPEPGIEPDFADAGRFPRPGEEPSVPPGTMPIYQPHPQPGEGEPPPQPGEGEVTPPPPSYLERLVRHKGEDWQDPEKLAEEYARLERRLGKTQHALQQRGQEVEALLHHAGEAMRQMQPTREEPSAIPPAPTPPPATPDADLQSFLENPRQFVQNAVGPQPDVEKIVDARVGTRVGEMEEQSAIREEINSQRTVYMERFKDKGETFNVVAARAMAIANSHPNMVKLFGPKMSVQRVFNMAEQQLHQEYAALSRLTAPDDGGDNGLGTPAPRVDPAPAPRATPGIPSAPRRQPIPGSRAQKQELLAAYAKAVKSGDSLKIAQLLLRDPTLSGSASPKIEEEV